MLASSTSRSKFPLDHSAENARLGLTVNEEASYANRLQKTWQWLISIDSAFNEPRRKD